MTECIWIICACGWLLKKKFQKTSFLSFLLGLIMPSVIIFADAIFTINDKCLSADGDLSQQDMLLSVCLSTQLLYQIPHMFGNKIK
jgi:hypothetical protein